MELLAGVVGVADVTVRTSAGLWRLCEHWQDAPRDVYLLRDDLGQANDFFAQIQRGLTMEQARGLDSRWPPESIRELERLLRDGRTLVLGIQQLVNELLNQNTTASIPSQPSLSKRRKAMWMKKLKWTSEQQMFLKKLMSNICDDHNGPAHGDQKRRPKHDAGGRRGGPESRDHLDTAVEASTMQITDHVSDGIAELRGHLRAKYSVVARLPKAMAAAFDLDAYKCASLPNLAGHERFAVLDAALTVR